MCVVLQNRLSHPLMKNLLPILHNHLHDVSERVRLALLDLLLVVKGMRTIKVRLYVCSVYRYLHAGTGNHLYTKGEEREKSFNSHLCFSLGQSVLWNIC